MLRLSCTDSAIRESLFTARWFLFRSVWMKRKVDKIKRQIENFQSPESATKPFYQRTHMAEMTKPLKETASLFRDHRGGKKRISTLGNRIVLWGMWIRWCFWRSSVCGRQRGPHRRGPTRQTDGEQAEEAEEVIRLWTLCDQGAVIRDNRETDTHNNSVCPSVCLSVSLPVCLPFQPSET